MKNIFLFFGAFLLLSCGSTKTLQSIENQSVEIRQTDTIFITKTQRIADTILVEIPKIITQNTQCDSLCNAQLAQKLAQISIKKQSGEHSAGIYFDKYKNQLVLYNLLQEQFDIYKAKNNQILKEKNKTIEREKIRYRTPTIVTYFAVFGAFSVLVFFGQIMRKFSNRQ